MANNCAPRSWFGPPARKTRLPLTSGQDPAPSRVVVAAFLPRTPPRSPIFAHPPLHHDSGPVDAGAILGEPDLAEPAASPPGSSPSTRRHAAPAATSARGHAAQPCGRELGGWGDRQHSAERASPSGPDRRHRPSELPIGAPSVRARWATARRWQPPRSRSPEGLRDLFNERNHLRKRRPRISDIARGNAALPSIQGKIRVRHWAQSVDHRPRRGGAAIGDRLHWLPLHQDPVGREDRPPDHFRTCLILQPVRSEPRR